MTSLPWYVASFRLVTLIEGLGLASQRISVVTLRASDFEEAFERALAIGLSMEDSYRNEDGREVRHRLAEIATLDQVDGADLDRQEVFSRALDIGEQQVSFDADFHPEESRPSMTGI